MNIANTHKVIGAYEKVDFPQFNLEGYLAKIDTGADTGALHCTKIHEEVVNGQTTLFFSPFDHPEIVDSTTSFFVRIVKSSNGQKEKRYFIETKIVIQGKAYPITLSLANRDQLKYPVLIGRKFLATNNFIVDVSQGESLIDESIEKGGEV